MFTIVDGSYGLSPRFAVTVGLVEGYGSSLKHHTIDEVIGLVESFLRKRAMTGLLFLGGIVTRGDAVYAWTNSNGIAGSGNEPTATFSGELKPLYDSAVSHKDVEEFLNVLATFLGVALAQTRIYVAFNGNMWILQDDRNSTPSGESV